MSLRMQKYWVIAVLAMLVLLLICRHGSVKALKQDTICDIFIDKPTVWTSDRIHELKQSVYVTSTLTIEGGAVIEYHPSARIVVHGGGQIVTNATGSQIILVQNKFPLDLRDQSSFFGGIRFVNCENPITLTSVTIVSPGFDGAVFVSNSTVALNSCKFTDGISGIITTRSANLTVNNCVFHNIQFGMSISTTSSSETLHLTVANSFFTIDTSAFIAAHSAIDVKCTQVHPDSSLLISQNQFYSGGASIRLVLTQQAYSVLDNKFFGTYLKAIDITFRSIDGIERGSVGQIRNNLFSGDSIRSAERIIAIETYSGTHEISGNTITVGQEYVPGSPRNDIRAISILSRHTNHSDQIVIKDNEFLNFNKPVFDASSVLFIDSVGVTTVVEGNTFARSGLFGAIVNWYTTEMETTKLIVRYNDFSQESDQITILALGKEAIVKRNVFPSFLKAIELRDTLPRIVDVTENYFGTPSKLVNSTTLLQTDSLALTWFNYSNPLVLPNINSATDSQINLFNPYNFEIVRGNVVWNTDRIIRQNVVVDFGASLTISKGSYLFAPNITLVVRGSLVINGSSADVLLTAYDKVWNGVFGLEGSVTNIFNATISKASAAITNGGTLILTKSRINNNTIGIASVSKESLTIASSEFRNNRSPFEGVSFYSTISIRSSIFSSNGASLIFNKRVGAVVEITDCIVRDVYPDLYLYEVQHQCALCFQGKDMSLTLERNTFINNQNSLHTILSNSSIVIRQNNFTSGRMHFTTANYDTDVIYENNNHKETYGALSIDTMCSLTPAVLRINNNTVTGTQKASPYLVGLNLYGHCKLVFEYNTLTSNNISHEGMHITSDEPFDLRYNVFNFDLRNFALLLRISAYMRSTLDLSNNWFGTNSSDAIEKVVDVKGLTRITEPHLPGQVLLVFNKTLKYADVNAPLIDPVYSNVASSVWSGSRIINGTVTILTGSTLTLAPGVLIRAAPNSRIVVKGHLAIQGTAGSLIRIECQGAFQIDIHPGGSISPISYLNMTSLSHSDFLYVNSVPGLFQSLTVPFYADHITLSGFNVIAFKTPQEVRITNSRIANMPHIAVTSSNVTLLNSVFQSNKMGVRAAGNCIIENCQFVDNTAEILQIYLTNSTARVVNNTFERAESSSIDIAGVLLGDLDIHDNRFSGNQVFKAGYTLVRALLDVESSGTVHITNNYAENVMLDLYKLETASCNVRYKLTNNIVNKSTLLGASPIEILQQCTDANIRPVSIIQHNSFEVLVAIPLPLITVAGSAAINNNTFLSDQPLLFQDRDLSPHEVEISDNVWKAYPTGATIHTKSIQKRIVTENNHYNFDTYYTNTTDDSIRYNVCIYESCFDTYRLSDDVCGGHGTCIALDVCECDNRWEGTNCTIPICDPGYMPYKYLCFPACDGITGGNTKSVCSGKGSCVAPEVCDCNYGFQGTNRCNYTMQTATFNSSVTNSSVIGACEKMQLKAAVDPTVGSVGALYNWYVDGELLKTVKTTEVVIESTELQPGIRSLYLQITSETTTLKTYNSTVLQVRVTRLLRPQVLVFGSSVSGRTFPVQAGTAFSINAQVLDPLCVQSSLQPAVTYSFQRTSPAGPQGTTVLNSLFLKATDLLQSGTFTYKATAYRGTGISRIESSILVNIQVFYLSPMAIIQGGSRNIGKSSIVVVNSLSTNPNRASPTNNGYLAWSFINNSNGTCLEGYNTGTSCTIDMNSINQVEVFLNFTIPEDTLSDRTSITVTRQVDVPGNPILFLSTLPNFINNNDRIVLSATAIPLAIFAGVRYKWDIMTAGLNTTSTGYKPYSAVNEPTMFLAVESGELKTNRLYTFKLTMSIPLSDRTVEISSELQSTVVNPPTVLNYTLQPQGDIYAYDTQISFEIEGKDTANFEPLSYAFYLDDEQGNKLTLAPYSRSNKVFTKLTAGRYTIRGCISNRINAFTCNSTSFLVKNKDLTAEQVTAIINQGIESIIHSDNIEASIALLLQFALTSTNETERVATALKLLDILEASYHLRKNTTDINALIDSQLNILKLFTSDPNPAIQQRVADYMLELLEDKILALIHSNEYGYSLGKILDGELFSSIATTISNILNGTQNSEVSKKVISGLDKLVKLAIADMIPSDQAINYTSPSLSIYLSTLYGSSLGGSLSAPNTDGNYIYIPTNIPTSSGTVLTVQIIEIKKDPYNSQNITSNIIDFTVIQNGTAVPFTGLETPINLTFTANRPLKPGETYKCQFWNTTLQQWDDRGCKTLNQNPCIELTNSTEVRCQCDHTTEFAAFIVYLPPCELQQTAKELRQDLILTGFQISLDALFAFASGLLFCFLFLNRNKQPIRSRQFAPFVGLAAIFIESVLSISQGSVNIRIRVVKSQSAISANIIGFIVIVVVNTVNLVALFCYMMQMARYTTLRNMYAIIKKVRKMKTGKKRGLNMKLYKMVTSQVTFIAGVVIVTVLSILYFTFFAIAVGIKKNFIAGKSYTWIVSISYAAMSVCFGLIILALFVWDIIVRKPKKLKSKSQQEPLTLTGIVRQFFVTDDPLYFRLELLFFLGAFFFLIASFVTGLTDTAMNNKNAGQQSIAGGIIEFIFSVCYTMFSLGMYGGFLALVRCREGLVNAQSHSSSSENDENTDASENKLQNKEQELIMNMIRTDKGYFLLERYCIAEFSVENLLVVKEVDDLKSTMFTIRDINEKNTKMKELYDKYISKKARAQVNMIAKTVKLFEEYLADPPQTNDVDEQIEILLNKVMNGAMANLMDTFTRFSLTTEYQVYKQSTEVADTAMEQFGLSVKQGSFTNDHPVQ